MLLVWKLVHLFLKNLQISLIINAQLHHQSALKIHQFLRKNTNLASRISAPTGCRLFARKSGRKSKTHFSTDRSLFTSLRPVSTAQINEISAQIRASTSRKSQIKWNRGATTFRIQAPSSFAHDRLFPRGWPSTLTVTSDIHGKVTMVGTTPMVDQIVPPPHESQGKIE